jgi:drug/metabolite transporter (DMT)-like permease
VRTSGTILCLASAAAFGAMGILGRLAYDDGATVGTLLSVRFLLAAVLFWALVVARGAGAELRTLGVRDVVAALGLGAGVYAAQAGGYFAALERVDPSLLSLLIYTFPAIVAVAAIAMGRERADARRLAALALVSAGLVLVLASSGAGSGDAIGAALGLGTALVYSVYVLVSEGVAGRVSPLLLSALVCSGAAVTLTVGSAMLGELRPGELTLIGWGWVACIAVVCTVAALSLFFAGLRRVGPTTASILCTAEPVVTVVLAFLAFSDVLGAAQLLGGAVVLGGVLVLRRAPVTA